MTIEEIKEHNRKLRAMKRRNTRRFKKIFINL